jgi:hypothetical protein
VPRFLNITIFDLWRPSLALMVIGSLIGCVRLARGTYISPPPERPPFIDAYYSEGRTYSGFVEHRVQPTKDYTVRRILIESGVGQISLDYYQRRQNVTEELILVFPVLGGKPIIESYLADYLVRHGYEVAIIHRNDEFKDPKLFDSLEQIFRNNIVRDRIAMDFFEKQYGKKSFGGVGMSRGAINLATLAGVDKRLEHNVYILGATDLAGVFKDSDQRRIANYVQFVANARNTNKNGFKAIFRQKVITEPTSFTRYLDPKKSLVFLAMFDKTVPFRHGMKLRRQMGDPETILLLSEHFTSVAFTQIVKLLPVFNEICLFPFDYIEGETLEFLDKSYNRPTRWWHLLPIRIIQGPLNVLTSGLSEIFISRASRITSPPDILKSQRIVYSGATFADQKEMKDSSVSQK